MMGNHLLAKRLPGFACRGYIFQWKFLCYFLVKEEGLMPGLTFSNELISRDEGLHTDFAVELYKTEKFDLDESVIHSIVKEAVEIETEFIMNHHQSYRNESYFND